MIEKFNFKLHKIPKQIDFMMCDEILRSYYNLKKVNHTRKIIYKDNVNIFVKVLKAYNEYLQRGGNGGVRKFDFSEENFENQDFSFPGKKDSDVTEMIFID